MGLLAYLARQVALDFSYLERHVEGFGAALGKALDIAPDTTQVARMCGFTGRSSLTVFDWVPLPKVVTAYSQGSTNPAAAPTRLTPFINCHLATGRISAWDGSFSLTGQPNAMGGREVVAGINSPHIWILTRPISIWWALDGTPHGKSKGAESGRSVSGNRKWPDQSALDHRHESRGQYARSRPGRCRP